MYLCHRRIKVMSLCHSPTRKGGGFRPFVPRGGVRGSLVGGRGATFAIASAHPRPSGSVHGSPGRTMGPSVRACVAILGPLKSVATLGVSRPGASAVSRCRLLSPAHQPTPFVPPFYPLCFSPLLSVFPLRPLRLLSRPLLTPSPLNPSDPLLRPLSPFPSPLRLLLSVSTLRLAAQPLSFPPP